METIEKKVDYKYTRDEITEMIVDFIKDVNQTIEENNYTLSENSRKSLDEMSKEKSLLKKGFDWSPWIDNLSKSGRKKLNKYIRRYYHKRSLKAMNNVFNFIYSRLLSKRTIVEHKYWSGTYVSWKMPEWITKVKVNMPQKHLDIQKKRKAWVKLRDEALEALQTYKEEKGDYYKIK